MLGKKPPTQSHCSACWSVCAITSNSSAENLRKKWEYQGCYVFIDFSQNRQLHQEDRNKILKLKDKQLQLSSLSVLRGYHTNKSDWPNEVRD